MTSTKTKSLPLVVLSLNVLLNIENKRNFFYRIKQSAAIFIANAYYFIAAIARCVQYCVYIIFKMQ